MAFLSENSDEEVLDLEQEFVSFSIERSYTMRTGVSDCVIQERRGIRRDETSVEFADHEPYGLAALASLVFLMKIISRPSPRSI